MMILKYLFLALGLAVCYAVFFVIEKDSQTSRETKSIIQFCVGLLVALLTALGFLVSI